MCYMLYTPTTGRFDFKRASFPNVMFVWFGNGTSIIIYPRTTRRFLLSFSIAVPRHSIKTLTSLVPSSLLCLEISATMSNCTVLWDTHIHVRSYVGNQRNVLDVTLTSPLAIRPRSRPARQNRRNSRTRTTTIVIIIRSSFYSHGLHHNTSKRDATTPSPY